jgi:gliding motility-associated-like protein
MITDANNCTISETFLVCTATATPGECYQGRRAISPNGDGFNDVFEIACVLDFDNFLKIYDRWGNLVFSATNYTNDWDGLNKDGSELTEGTYLWILKVDEPGKEDAYYKGTVTIVR